MRDIDYESLETFFRLSLDMLSVSGSDGFFKFLNPAWEATLGFSEKELKSKPFIDFVHPEDRTKTIQEIKKLDAKASIAVFENRYITKDGHYRWLSWSTSPSGSNYYTIARDITQRKELEEVMSSERLRATNAAKLASIGEMAAGLAHEINNPLSTILGCAVHLKELSEREKIDHSMLIQYSDRIARVTRRVSRITKGLRSFSREGSEDPFQLTSVSEIVANTLEFCRVRIKNAGLRLILEPISEEFKIECREVQIAQVLLNLLNNAFDAAEASTEKWIKIEATESQEHIFLAVSDSGTKISEEIRAHLFKAFFTTKAVGVGTGLGLSLSYNLVKAHHGHLELDSSCLHTKFVVTLPKHPPHN